MSKSIKDEKVKNGGKTVEKAPKTAAEGSKEHIAELGKGTRFSATNQPENRRQQALAKRLDSVPDDAKEQLASIAWAVLKCKSKREAEELIRGGTENMEGGLVYQRWLLEVLGKNGFRATMELIYWLFGTPRQDISVRKIEPPEPLEDLRKNKEE